MFVGMAFDAGGVASGPMTGNRLFWHLFPRKAGSSD